MNGLEPQWFVPWFLGGNENSVYGRFIISLVCNCSGDIIRTARYAHLQHMNVAKHLIFVWNWFMTSPLEWVLSLNYHTMVWFAPTEGYGNSREDSKAWPRRAPGVTS